MAHVVARIARRSYATAFRAYRAQQGGTAGDVATAGAASGARGGGFRRADGTGRGQGGQAAVDDSGAGSLKAETRLVPVCVEDGPLGGTEVMPAAGGGGAEESYADALRHFVLHRSFRRLLLTDDAPHPLKVYRDVEELLGTVPDCCRSDVSELLAHAHVLLRVLADTDRRDDEQEVSVAPSSPGELILTTKQENTALHWAYHDTLALWELLKERHEVGRLAVSSMLRCCSVVADTERAVGVFDSYKNAGKRFSNTLLVNSMLWVYAEKGEMATCVKLYRALKESAGRVDVDTFEAMLHCAFRINEVHTVLKTWHTFTMKMQITPRNTTWEMMALGCLDSGFENHAVLYFERYKETGAVPSSYCQMRMTERYSKAIEENYKPGSKIPNAVTRGPHLSYKMMIDFCSVRTMRDLMLPDNVPAVQPHYYAPLDGAGSGMEVTQTMLAPRHDRNKIGARFTSHSGRTKEWMVRGTGRVEFAPPGTKHPPRKDIKSSSKFRDRRTKSGKRQYSHGDYNQLTQGFKRKGKVKENLLGNKGSGAWCEEQRWAGSKFKGAPLLATG
eukprot:TRINITY_DN9789_c0_g1_i1.p1 TRINITY_DN9789_c0_g1~~TRINITY_DN9789_c0_g1_i1.p1  ORF type:complete len:559 (+),score=168.27 TRINITY_DN9789_c0_g1_i1:67-1743(+)